MAVKFYGINHSNVVCDNDPDRDSCFLTDVQLGEADAIAAIRMVISCLSILGSISVVTWAILKKQVYSSKVHPIFVLSLADTILAVLWIAGGWLWLRRAPSQVGCFAVSLPTVILQCVTVNLTLVYALLAYSSIKQKKLNNLLVTDSSNMNRVWRPVTNLIAYLIAWLTPMVIVMFIFGVIAGQTGLVMKADSCSCFCLPVFGNVVPYVFPRDEGSGLYVYATTLLIFWYGLVVGTNTLIVFILLVVIYYKLLKYINTMRKEYESVHNVYHYGAMGSLLISGQSKAKKRVMYFLTVFVINGFCNFILAYSLMCTDALVLSIGPYYLIDPSFRTRDQDIKQKLYVIGVLLQSLTAPLQGFLNAIVYGWTRDDFLYVMSYTNNTNPDQHDLVESAGDNLELEKSAEFPGNALKKEERTSKMRLSNTNKTLGYGRVKVRGRNSSRSLKEDVAQNPTNHEVASPEEDI